MNVHVCVPFHVQHTIAITVSTQLYFPHCFHVCCRAQAYIKDSVTGFQPRPDDLAYPSKLEAAAAAAAGAEDGEVAEGETAQGEEAEVGWSPYVTQQARLWGFLLKAVAVAAGGSHGGGRDAGVV
jgi:hypothetical protein